MLSLAAHTGTGQSALEPSSDGGGVLILAIMASCLAGLSYGIGSVVVRRCVTGNVTLSATLFIIGGTGVICLGAGAVSISGIEAVRQTSMSDWLTMLAAGAFNALAFFTLAKSLQFLTVLHANLINGSQVAMSALAGVLLFGEALTLTLISGVILTTVGLSIIRGNRRVPSTQQDSESHRSAESVDPEAQTVYTAA